ncbi:STAS domain-containing protein [Streptomyces sp. H27-C3]|uniref:STAS domain-containing protein n=1 Tax=Streptomyces sp. H27-C3 TaxID=3046305 RepID=UPI0024BAC461|nr:STAS domain-containing protein [Streptomyces sp. H27-C3]MDJ0463362.1 STAS domain-containing protein [Streptomyces sp. H27-C3]
MSDTSGLALSHHHHGTATVVAVTGGIDFHNAPALHTRCLALIEQGHPHLVLDLSQVAFCDSSGLNTFINLWHRTQAADGSLALAALPVSLDQVLRLTGLDTLLPVHASAADALSAPGALPLKTA